MPITKTGETLQKQAFLGMLARVGRSLGTGVKSIGALSRGAAKNFSKTRGIQKRISKGRIPFSAQKNNFTHSIRHGYKGMSDVQKRGLKHLGLAAGATGMFAAGYGAAKTPKPDFNQLRRVAPRYWR